MNQNPAPVLGGAPTLPSTGNVVQQSGPNPFAVRVEKKPEPPAPVSFTPTPEQEAILDGFRAGHDMVISAGAGTGKTSTITLLAEDMYHQDRSSRGVYIAFNKSIANEVGSKLFYGNVMAMTVHSLAFRWAMNHPTYSALMPKLNRDFREIMTRRERVKAFNVGKYERFGEHPEPFDPRDNPILYQVTGSTLVTDAMEALKRFCQSDDAQVKPFHVRLTTNVHEKVRDKYRARVAEVAQRMWDTDITSPSGRLPFAHDNYLKIYAMSSPNIPEQLGLRSNRTVLFFDEAQDSRPCITQIVMAQRGRMQLVMCGDSSQAIYRFTGCRDAIRGFKKFDAVKTFTLSKTFRFGAEIALLANQVLNMVEGSDVRIIPDLSIDSKVVMVADTDKQGYIDVRGVDAVICRSNRQLIETTINLLGTGVKVFCAADTKMITSIAEDFITLSNGGTPKTPVMKQFRSIGDVMDILTRQPVVPGTEGDVEPEVDETTLSILTAIERNGASNVLNAIRSCVRDETRADVVISTIHKSKGRQWDRVMIQWDAASMTRLMKYPHSLNDELMLLYVAVTRARKVLRAPSALLGALYLAPSMRSPESVAESMGDPSVLADDDSRAIPLYVQAILGIEQTTLDKALVDSVTRQMMRDNIAPHELVGALVFTSDKYLPNIEHKRDITGYILSTFVAAVGVKNILEVADLSDSGMPDELLAAMLSPSEDVELSNGDLERINLMLDPK